MHAFKDGTRHAWPQLQGHSSTCHPPALSHALPHRMCCMLDGLQRAERLFQHAAQLLQRLAAPSGQRRRCSFLQQESVESKPVLLMQGRSWRGDGCP